MRLRNVNKVHAKGRIYFYHRKTGVRLTGEPGSPEFLRQWEAQEGMAASAEPLAGSLGALIAAYRASPEFREKAERTRSDYQRVFDYLKPLDAMPLEQVDQPFVIGVRDEAFEKRKRRFANYVLQVLSLLFVWGKPRGFIASNPAQDAPKIKRPRGMAKANRAWSDEERKIVLAAAPASLRAGIALGMFVGLREGDACRWPRSAYDGATIRGVAAKNGGPITLPAHPELRAILDEALKVAPKVAKIGPAGDETPIMLGERSKAGYTVSGFRARFFKLIRELTAAGKVRPGLTFHGLRHTLGKLLGDAGCDTRDIAAVFSITEAMAEHYSREASRERRAKGALLKLERKGKRAAKPRG